MVLSQYTAYLSEALCGGSSRKLIAGWWYSILAMTLVLTIFGVVVLGSRSFPEGFAAVWSGLMLCALSVGGTMIMRKFHSSLAVGFFMGCVVAMSQMFFMLFLLYVGYYRDVTFKSGQRGFQEIWLAMFAFTQSTLLASFAGILAAHRSEILEKPGSGASVSVADEAETVGTYDAPSTLM